ncbi:unnamed protein product [Effrenium voratum]|uniref:Uncharacterized protein n=1 Tax=Effrenium voratum TaxID=2562239 RepID=A0AA36NHY9_9DINO|nr:unnamed protein product [Effrenium voratum]
MDEGQGRRFGRAIARARRAGWRQAQQVLAEMRPLQVQRDLLHCNAVLSGCADFRRWQMASALFQLNGLQLDVRSFNIAASATALLAWRRSLLGLSQLRWAGLEPSPITLGGLCSSQGKALRWRAALELLAVPGFRPSSAHLGPIMAAAPWCQALRLLCLLWQSGQEASDLALSACQTAGAAASASASASANSGGWRRQLAPLLNAQLGGAWIRQLQQLAAARRKRFSHIKQSTKEDGLEA